jgi:HSP20 family protein
MAIEKWKPRDLSTWHPFRELEEIERRFEDTFGRSFLSWWPMRGEEWLPTVDILEKEDSFVTQVELPGMRRDDIDISVTGNMLTISGERKLETEVNKGDYRRRERSYGRFSRSMNLPSNVDGDKIKASFEDGVLEIVLPKTAESKTKKIAVSEKKSSD